jgi:hypothetical protein
MTRCTPLWIFAALCWWSSAAFIFVLAWRERESGGLAAPWRHLAVAWAISVFVTTLVWAWAWLVLPAEVSGIHDD